jgi:hypothetical protein
MGVFYNFMAVLMVDLHSFTKNRGVFPEMMLMLSRNDAYVFPKTMQCFSENISIISENESVESLTSVRLIENSVKSILFMGCFLSFST